MLPHFKERVMIEEERSFSSLWVQRESYFNEEDIFSWADLGVPIQDFREHFTRDPIAVCSRAMAHLNQRLSQQYQDKIETLNEYIEWLNRRNTDISSQLEQLCFENNTLIGENQRLIDNIERLNHSTAVQEGIETNLSPERAKQASDNQAYLSLPGLKRFSVLKDLNTVSPYPSKGANNYEQDLSKATFQIISLERQMEKQREQMHELQCQLALYIEREAQSHELHTMNLPLHMISVGAKSRVSNSRVSKAPTMTLQAQEETRKILQTTEDNFEFETGSRIERNSMHSDMRKTQSHLSFLGKGDQTDRTYRNSNWKLQLPPKLPRRPLIMNSPQLGLSPKADLIRNQSNGNGSSSRAIEETAHWALKSSSSNWNPYMTKQPSGLLTDRVPSNALPIPFRKFDASGLANRSLDGRFMSIPIDLQESPQQECCRKIYQRLTRQLERLTKQLLAQKMKTQNILMQASPSIGSVKCEEPSIDRAQTNAELDLKTSQPQQNLIHPREELINESTSQFNLSITLRQEAERRPSEQSIGVRETRSSLLEPIIQQVFNFQIEEEAAQGLPLDDNAVETKLSMHPLLINLPLKLKIQNVFNFHIQNQVQPSHELKAQFNRCSNCESQIKATIKPIEQVSIGVEYHTEGQRALSPLSKCSQNGHSSDSLLNKQRSRGDKSSRKEKIKIADLEEHPKFNEVRLNFLNPKGESKTTKQNVKLIEKTNAVRNHKQDKDHIRKKDCVLGARTLQFSLSQPQQSFCLIGVAPTRWESPREICWPIKTLEMNQGLMFTAVSVSRNRKEILLLSPYVIINLSQKREAQMSMFGAKVIEDPCKLIWGNCEVEFQNQSLTFRKDPSKNAYFKGTLQSESWVLLNGVEYTVCNQ